MTRSLTTGLCVCLLLLVGCDATQAPTASPDVAPDPFAELNVALDDFQHAFDALDASERRDQEIVRALLDKALVDHFGERAPSVQDGGVMDRRFGPFTIAFGGQQRRTGTLSGTFPGTFDVYLYDIVGNATAEFSAKMEDDNAPVGAQLRINGQIVDQDVDTDKAGVEAIVTAPASALVGVAYTGTPPGGFPATYLHRVEFQPPN